MDMNNIKLYYFLGVNVDSHFKGNRRIESVWERGDETILNMR
jgi:hypothetical protein